MGVAQARNEIGKQLVVTVAPFGMILDREGERIIAQPNLLDDVIGRTPGFDFQVLAEFVESLVMGTVDLVEAMRRGAVGP